MANNVVTAKIVGKIGKSEPVFQYDTNMQLRFTSTSLPQDFEVHFQNPNNMSVIIRAVASEGMVPIPTDCLTAGKDVIAWVYERGQSSGVTLAQITIPVIARSAVPAVD